VEAALDGEKLGVREFDVKTPNAFGRPLERLEPGLVSSSRKDDAMPSP